MFVILLCHTYGSPPPSPRSCPSLHSLFHFSSSSHQPSSSYNAAESFSSARTDLLHGNHAHKSPSSTRLAASDNEFTSTKLAANLLLLFSLYVGLLYHRGNWRLQAGVLGGKVKEHNGKQPRHKESCWKQMNQFSSLSSVDELFVFGMCGILLPEYCLTDI